MQSIILALLFMAVRAKQHEHSRVVIVVPTNVQFNWMDELEQWLSEFTTSGVTRREGHLTLVCSPTCLHTPTAMRRAASKLPVCVRVRRSASKPGWLRQSRARLPRVLMHAWRSRCRCELLPGMLGKGAGCLLQETPDLRLSAWVLEGASRLDPVQRWFERGAAPSAKAVKASNKREKMLRTKLKVPIATTTQPHGSILLVTHSGFRDLWRAGQLDCGGGSAAPTHAAQALQHVVAGAGLVIMDEAHCIRNANTNVRCPPLPCSVGAPQLDHLPPGCSYSYINQPGVCDSPVRCARFYAHTCGVRHHNTSVHA